MTFLTFGAKKSKTLYLKGSVLGVITRDYNKDYNTRVEQN